MHKVKKFSANDRSVSHFCLGKKIKEFQCECNAPIEEDCIKITLENGAEIRIYSLVRVIRNNRLIFSISDFWADKDIPENAVKVEKQLIGSRIEKVKFNKTGDCTLFLDSGEEIQNFIDTSKEEMDYLRIDMAAEYYNLCRCDKEITIIKGKFTKKAMKKMEEHVNNYIKNKKLKAKRENEKNNSK